MVFLMWRTGDVLNKYRYSIDHQSKIIKMKGEDSGGGKREEFLWIFIYAIISFKTIIK